MNREGRLLVVATFVCSVAAGCDDSDAHDEHGNSGADSGVDSGMQGEPDAAAADSGPTADAAEDAGGEPGDQTPPSGANGLAFDGDGMVWLADLFGDQVLRFDPASGEILARYSYQGAGPDDIAIDEQGVVFWTGWSSGEVGRIDPATGDERIIAELPQGANSIAFAEDGRLFVGLVILNVGLYEIDPEGSDDPRLVTDELGSFNAFTFDSDGFLWGPAEDAVVKVDPETGEVLETAVEGGYSAVRYNAEDEALYALTNGEDASDPAALVRIPLDSLDLRPFSEPDLDRVDNFAIGPDGSFYVTAFSVPEVVVIDASGSHIELLEIGSE